MRQPAIAFAVCALAATSLLGAQATDTERVSRTLKLEPGGTLRLKSFSGRVTVTGTDRPEVVIDAVRHGSRERLNRIKLDIHADGSNVVVVDANRHDGSWFDFTGRNNAVDTDFDIQVPRRTHLDFAVFSAPVSVDGVHGSHRIKTFSSRVTLNDAGGSIKAHTFSGSVVIRETKWAAKPDINVDTFSGSVELHVPEGAHGDVTFNSFSGRLSSAMPLTLHSSSERRVRAELGGGGNGFLTFKTFSGSVRIDR
jgi:DUF4097 and DUF4098 domain-containing protein YvlB